MTNYKIISQDVNTRSETSLKRDSWSPHTRRQERKPTAIQLATGTHSGSHLYPILQDSFQSYFPTYKNATHFLVSQVELYIHFTFSILIDTY